ncbi:hypothetical protein KGMB02408_02210 [Bacteroides faecalis]|uniref:Uncharacterized protein n=1 Tax=Bacteroides faecalis TaxID=2447885 RepID=A0A401LP10_9BACE|nr:hypothetical protein KGMB02408_02210 [Bacteroides faecalis]
MVDPMCEKYYSESLYLHCKNNSVNIIDPDGKDIIVLHDRKGAGGFGHTAVLIGNETDGWFYLSKDGGQRLIVSDIPEVGNKKFNNIQQFDNSEYAAKFHGYQTRARFTSTNEQDDAAFVTMWKEMYSWYDVTNHNCMDAVGSALRTAGFYADENYYMETHNLSGHSMILRGDPRPNQRYDKLLKMNADFIIWKTENANRQYNKSNSWNNFINLLGKWLTSNPNIIFKW